MMKQKHSGLSVDDNPEPWSDKSMRSITSARIHKRQCNGTISSRYQGVILEGGTRQKLNWVVDWQKTSAPCCLRNGIKGENHGQNHDRKGPNHRCKMNLYQGDTYLTRSFHDKFYIVSMGMNTKVQGRLPLLQCITLHSLLAFDEVLVMKFYLA